MAQKVSTEYLQAQRLFSVEGWVCLVTGGGTGIGLMCSQALAANGAKVYITGRRKEVLETAAQEHSPRDGPGKLIPIGPCDVTSKADLDQLAKSLAERGETHLNLLVCNAGISGPKADPADAPEPSSAASIRDHLWAREDPQAWASVFDTNATAVYFTALAFLPLLQAAMPSSSSSSSPSSDDQRAHDAHLSSSIIVISSVSGIMRGAQGHFAYNAAKGATVHLARLMSAEFERTRVRVNSIAPGYFPSEMTAKDSDEHNKSDLPDEAVRGKGHEVPAGRAGSDEEMAMAALFLAKNRYVNGEVLVVDGGVLNNVPGR
jgi:NAD(P)-dependent dehydrogenase (short-subunit alcohol dehydrogenase family)